MPNLYNEVGLTSDLAEYGLRNGVRGAVVDISALSRGVVTVEFYRDDYRPSRACGRGARYGSLCLAHDLTLLTRNTCHIQHIADLILSRTA